MHKTSALVVGKFAPFHNGHKHLIDHALQHADHVVVLAYSNPDFPSMPQHARTDWIRETHKNQAVSVFAPTGMPPDHADDFAHREFVRQWLMQHNLPFGSRRLHNKAWPDMVFGSEDYIPGFAKHIECSAHVVDKNRAAFPISGTGLRDKIKALTASAKLLDLDEEVLPTWDTDLLEDIQHHVPPATHAGLQFWARPVQNVVFLGAESTGKSTLAARLAAEFACPVVAEYGREVWERNNGNLSGDDYAHIASQHRVLEVQAMLAAAQQQRPYVFVDTNAITTMFLGYAYAGGVPQSVQDRAKLAETRYHHVFVCDDDIPFAQDGWRDDAVWRLRAQHMVLYDLAVRGVPYTLVSGTLEERVATVKACLQGRFERK